MYIATPSRGTPRPEFFASVWKLINAANLEWHAPFDIPSVVQRSQDLVRVRSRLVRMFLETSFTHLLFLDDDVEFEPEAILGMLAADLDIVCCPYPHRGTGLWKVLVDPSFGPVMGDPAKLGGYLNEHGHTMPINGTGLGCCLIKREALERMVEHYRTELEFVDVDDSGLATPTVALFLLTLLEGHLLGEDNSFFLRARQMGLDPRMYLGRGSPINHRGELVFHGSLEAFGLRRVEE